MSYARDIELSCSHKDFLGEKKQEKKNTNKRKLPVGSKSLA